MKRFFKSVMLFLLIITTISCGAISHGTIQDITITAPSDALVKVNGRTAKGSTVMKLKRNKSYLVSMQK